MNAIIAEISAMQKLVDAERRMLRQMSPADRQRLRNIGSATDWDTMVGALIADQTGPTFEPESDQEGVDLVPETCAGCECWLPPGQGWDLSEPEFEELKRRRRHLLLAHMATHHPPAPPDGPRIETGTVTAPPPPAVSANPPVPILLKVQDREGKEVQFRINKHTHLGKLMKSYCERMGLPSAAILFMCGDGMRINPWDTAEAVGLDDEGIITAVHASP